MSVWQVCSRPSTCGTSWHSAHNDPCSLPDTAPAVPIGEPGRAVATSHMHPSLQGSLATVLTCMVNGDQTAYVTRVRGMDVIYDITVVHSPLEMSLNITASSQDAERGVLFVVVPERPVGVLDDAVWLTDTFHLHSSASPAPFILTSRTSPAGAPNEAEAIALYNDHRNWLVRCVGDRRPTDLDRAAVTAVRKIQMAGLLTVLDRQRRAADDETAAILSEQIDYAVQAFGVVAGAAEMPVTEDGA